MTSTKKPYHYIKIITVGDSGVGKSSLVDVLQGHDRQQVLTQTSTCGANFDTIPINSDQVFLDIDSKSAHSALIKGQDPNFRLQIWDTSGQERFRSMANAYFRRVEGIILVFDVTRPDTFQSLIDYWIPAYEKITGKNIQNTPCVIVANQIDKMDIEGRDAKQYGELTARLQHLADRINTSFTITSMVFETFEISQQNVANIIQKISHRVLLKHYQRQSTQFLKDHSDLIVLAEPSNNCRSFGTPPKHNKKSKQGGPCCIVQ